MSITIDGRILDTDNRFHDYCMERKIENPFWEDQQRFSNRVERKQDEKGRDYWVVDTTKKPEDEAWEKDWAKKRDWFLRLEHTFRLWDFHFWMTWEQFEWYLKYDKDYTDVSIYMPCDCADRQCSMTCAYFGGECPRMKEEVKIPESLGFEGRWEFHDDYNY